MPSVGDNSATCDEGSAGPGPGRGGERSRSHSAQLTRIPSLAEVEALPDARDACRRTHRRKRAERVNHSRGAPMQQLDDRTRCSRDASASDDPDAAPRCGHRRRTMARRLRRAVVTPAIGWRVENRRALGALHAGGFSQLSPALPPRGRKRQGWKPEGPRRSFIAARGASPRARPFATRRGRPALSCAVRRGCPRIGRRRSNRHWSGSAGHHVDSG